MTADLKRSRNGEIYYFRKYVLWKEHATVNRMGNFRLAENYLNLESYCEGLKDQLLQYQSVIHGDDFYKECTSSSVVNPVFPALPMRPELVSSLYFSGEELRNKEVLQIVKGTYRGSEMDAIKEKVKANLDDVKGKCIDKLSLSKAYKNHIQELAKQEEGSTNVVIQS